MNSERSKLKIVITNTNDSESESPTTLKTGPLPISSDFHSTENLFQMIIARLQECESQNLFKHSQNLATCAHCVLFEQLKTLFKDIDQESQNSSSGNKEGKLGLCDERLSEMKKVYTRLEKAFLEDDQPKANEKVCSCGMSCDIF